MNDGLVISLSRAEISELILWAQSHHDESVMSTFGANLEDQLLRYYSELSRPKDPNDSI
jgi:hypothetical protein